MKNGKNGESVPRQVRRVRWGWLRDPVMRRHDRYAATIYETPTGNAKNAARGLPLDFGSFMKSQPVKLHLTRPANASQAQKRQLSAGHLLRLLQLQLFRY